MLYLNTYIWWFALIICGLPLFFPFIIILNAWTQLSQRSWNILQTKETGSPKVTRGRVWRSRWLLRQGFFLNGCRQNILVGSRLAQKFYTTPSCKTCQHSVSKPIVRLAATLRPEDKALRNWSSQQCAVSIGYEDHIWSRQVSTASVVRCPQSLLSNSVAIETVTAYKWHIIKYLIKRKETPLKCWKLVPLATSNELKLESTVDRQQFKP